MEGPAQYTGSQCRKCRRPLEIMPGGGSDELQRLKVVCERCARKLAAPVAERAWQRQRAALDHVAAERRQKQATGAG